MKTTTIMKKITARKWQTRVYELIDERRLY